MMTSIPHWNSSAVLPPIRTGKTGNSLDRSPYRVKLGDIVERFAISNERTQILKGLIEYRRKLRFIGITNGFQWLDGSFMENVEESQSRSPNDIDVVTFFYLPNGVTQKDFLRKHVDLFTPLKVKENYKVDAYACVLGEKMDNTAVGTISYWYSMWSHRRDFIWKGFIQVNLSEEEDQEASNLLT